MENLSSMWARICRDSLPLPLIERLGGLDKLDFCAPCLSDNLSNSGDGRASKATMIKYLKDLTALIGRVPTQNFGEGITDLHDMDLEERAALLRLRTTRPSTKRIQSIFGSWLNAQNKSGNSLKMAREEQVGEFKALQKMVTYVYHSARKQLMTFCINMAFIMRKSPKYPEGNFRGDFKVNGIMIEYFGLVGNPDYDTKIVEDSYLSKT